MRRNFNAGLTTLLASSLALVLTACSGSDGAAGATGSTGSTGPQGDPGLGTARPGLVVNIGKVSNVGGAVTVEFNMLDSKNNPVDIAGNYSVNTVIAPRFAIAKVTKDGNGLVQPYQVLSNSCTTATPPVCSPTAFNPASGTTTGKLVDNGGKAGSYTYTFPTSVVMDAASATTHVVWIQAARQTDLVNTTAPATFYPVNQQFSFIPSGVGTPITREIVVDAACTKCHSGFKAEGSTGNEFHGGGRIAPPFCNVCHNPGRTSNPAADSSVFVHRIHNAEALQDNASTNNIFHGIIATYPQDVRNCDACHAGAAQGAQHATNPSRTACGSCHDYVKFDGTGTGSCAHPPAVSGTTGQYAVCNHNGDVQTSDTTCSGCHTAAKIDGYHVPTAAIDPCNTFSFAANNAACLATGATAANSRTNAGVVPAAGKLPAGAAVMTAAIGNVLVEANGNPSLTFKFVKNGTDVVFNTFSAATNEMMTGFTGSPNIYFAFSVPQDGIASADFNVTANVFLKRVWNGNITTSSLTGPDAGGFYKLTILNTFIPASATQLTGGIGYAYSLATGTYLTRVQPLTQTDLTGDYAYDFSTNVGGLVVTMPNVWKVATGYTARRDIVDNAKCLACHAQLGVNPSFHVGQRNDGPTCSFCHTANQNSNGWSANSKDFLHALHAGRVRSQPYMWHAVSATDNFADVEFPSPLNNCVACHKPGTYDFTATASAAALNGGQLLWSTEAAGTTIAANAIANSPYVTVGFAYGAGFSYNASTNVIVAAATNSLVTSPITAACIACHDSSSAYSHMALNGGYFYQPRSSMPSPTNLLAVREACMTCHGAGAVADIKVVHGQ